MAKIRQFDRTIQGAEQRLAAVERRELWPLDGSERRAIVSAVAVGGVRAARNRSTARADRAIETTWSNAEARLRSEIAATQRAKAKAIEEAAAKKARGWF